MYEIQDKFLSLNEKRKRDRALKKWRGNKIVDREEVIVNASLLDSNISNKKPVILREARAMWEIRKKIGFSIQGDE